MEFTIKEVAERLNIPVETVQRWIRQGKIPMQGNRGEYTIRPEMLERWADEHKLNVRAQQAIEEVREPVFDGILPAMQRGGFFYGLSGDAGESALRAAVERIPNLAAHERPLILDRLIEREAMASTGIGHGIALPHPRANPDIHLVQPQITTCFLERPIAFDAIDHRPVSVLMVLLSGSTKLHLTLLSQLTFYLRDTAFRDFLLSAPPAEALLEKVRRLESKNA